MIQDTLKKYNDFVRKHDKEKSEMKEKVMLSLLDDITKIMVTNGWEKKGKGSVTQSMVQTNTLKINFVKDYNGNKVIIQIRTFIKDDYLSSDGGSYNELKLTGSKCISEKGWLPSSTSFKYFPRSYDGWDDQNLVKKLKLIDKYNQ